MAVMGMIAITVAITITIALRMFVVSRGVFAVVCGIMIGVFG